MHSTVYMQISILLLPLNTSEKYLESETNTIGDIPFNILHMSILPGTVHLKKRKKTTLLHTEHLKIHILDANKHPLLLIIVMMSVQFVPCALKPADGKVFILSTSLINQVIDVLSRHSLNSSKPRTSLKLLLLFPNVPYVLTIATLLVLYSLEVKTHIGEREREKLKMFTLEQWHNIFKNKKQKQCICWKHFSAKAGIPSIQCVDPRLHLDPSYFHICSGK